MIDSPQKIFSGVKDTLHPRFLLTSLDHHGPMMIMEMGWDSCDLRVNGIKVSMGASV